MARVLEEAWKELMAMLAVQRIDANAMRDRLVRRIAALRAGEREPKRLKLFALGVFQAILDMGLPLIAGVPPCKRRNSTTASSELLGTINGSPG